MTPRGPKFTWTEHRLIRLATMAATGHTARQIQAAVGAPSIKAVYNAVRRYGIELGPKPFGGPILSIEVGDEHLPLLEAEARERAMEPGALAGQILRAVLGDGIVAAVLDSAG
jgi:hypothetical protein